MNEKYAWWELVISMGFIVLFAWLGYAYGASKAEKEVTARLTHEAVRERAGQWVPAEDGSPSFKWSVCVPAKPQEVKK